MRLCATWRAAFAALVLLPLARSHKDNPQQLRARPASATGRRGIERPARRGDEGCAPLQRRTVAISFGGRSSFATGAAGACSKNEQIVPRLGISSSRAAAGSTCFHRFLETGTGQHQCAPHCQPRSVRGHGAGRIRRSPTGIFETACASPRPPFPAVASLEGMHDRRTGLSTSGWGRFPGRPAQPVSQWPMVGVYRERRERGDSSIGLRPLRDVEVLLSSASPPLPPTTRDPRSAVPGVLRRRRPARTT
jgi:hypothetical protein